MSPRIAVVMALCLLEAFAAPGCRLQPKPELAATYKGGQITVDEYRGWLAFANLEDEPAERAARLGQIAMGRVLSGALQARGGERDPEVAGQLADLEERVRCQALRRQAMAEVKINEDQVDEALRENDKDRHQPRRVQLANLFKRVPADAGPAARKAARARIQELRRQVQAGADFAELAGRESDSETRFRGGRMGVAAPGQLPPQLEKVAFALGEGEVSEVLEQADGFTLLKCLRILPESTMSVEEARQKLRRYLESKARERRLEEIQSEALRRWPMTGALAPAAIRSAEPPMVIARFGERAVTRGDLDRWLQAGRSQTVDKMSDDALRAVLQDQASQHASAKRARELALETRPEVGDRLAWERLRVQATAEMERRVGQTFQKPTEEELRARFDSVRERMVQPKRYRVSVLRFGCGDEPLPACYRSAEGVLARLQRGALSFERAARELSIHPSRTQGGDLGWRTARSLAVLGPNVLSTIRGLSVGALSPVVRDEDALWVLKLAAEEPERPQTFDEARLSVERELGNDRVQEIQKRLQEQLLAELDVRVSEVPGRK